MENTNNTDTKIKTEEEKRLQRTQRFGVTTNQQVKI